MIPDLVIFDCDGVLVDTEPLTAPIIAASLSHYGLNIDAHEVDKLFTGGTMGGVMAEGRRRGATLPDDWLDEIYAAIFARLSHDVDVFDGVFDLLDALNTRDVPTYIASNGPMEKMRNSLGPSGLWDRFSGRILSREHHTPKPDPAMILYALAQTGADPETSFMIDDSVSGCSAGLAAGVRTIGFATQGQDDTLTALGATVANSMADVRRLILP